jgi:hypothetical protein
MSIFTSGKEIWIYNKSLNQFPFHMKKHQESNRGEIRRWMKKLERRSIVCSKSSFLKNKKLKKTMKKKRKKEKRPKVNLIISHINQTFWILVLWIGPQAFRHTHCTNRKKCFFNVKKGSIQGPIWFKLILGLLVLGPLSTMALIYLWRKVVCLFCLVCTYEIHRTGMLQIMFLVSLESSPGGGVHQFGFMAFGLAV